MFPVAQRGASNVCNPLPLAGQREGMTPRQQRFVHEYVVDSNSARAAIRAGFAPRSAKFTNPCDTMKI